MVLVPYQGTSHPVYKKIIFVFFVFIPHQCVVHHVEVDLEQMTLKIWLFYIRGQVISWKDGNRLEANVFVKEVLPGFCVKKSSVARIVLS